MGCIIPGLAGTVPHARQHFGTIEGCLHFQAFIFRLTESQDAIVGAPTIGRSKAEFLPIVSDFVNAVPLRAQMTTETTFVN
jgi:non-ribosomal peptide synthetase component F